MHAFSVVIASTLSGRDYSHFTETVGLGKAVPCMRLSLQERGLGLDSGLGVQSVTSHPVVPPPFTGAFTKSGGLVFCLCFSFPSYSTPRDPTPTPILGMKGSSQLLSVAIRGRPP